MPSAWLNGQQTAVANGQSRSEGTPSRATSDKSLAWSQAPRLRAYLWSGAGSNCRPSAFRRVVQSLGYPVLPTLKRDPQGDSALGQTWTKYHIAMV